MTEMGHQAKGVTPPLLELPQLRLQEHRKQPAIARPPAGRTN